MHYSRASSVILIVFVNLLIACQCQKTFLDAAALRGPFRFLRETFFNLSRSPSPDKAFIQNLRANVRMQVD